MNYKQLTRNQRYVISTLNERNCTQKEIADEVDVHPSTISRELNRNGDDNGYDPEQAHDQALQRRTEKGTTRIDTEEWSMIEDFINKKWSPEQISGRMEKEGKLQVSHTWIYKYIWADKQEGGDLHENLRHDNENRKEYGSKDTHPAINNRTSIEERPDVVDRRDRIGDWEADTIIGKGHKGVLLTLVERKSRLAIIRVMEGKTAEEAGRKLVEVLSNHKDRVHTLTNDNGGEFAAHERTAEELDTNIYFADPYSSWQRGAVENMNGLIRQYFPKGQPLDSVSQKEVLRVQRKLNSRPRKCLNWQTPFNAFFDP